MVFRGKEICGIEVYDETNDDMVIVSICDDVTETKNGYKIRIIPYNTEVDKQ